ncbi:hypothetical protein QBC37DRAFT_397257 [Rhypophila decipiens]|uniref:Cyanovirin-N domain-containing protein n=1 Tax=Rhypophila decipiens TaxID=261697 RepID=A0AAN6YD58_9PEZI|nr:hypothetical protein QBC37DRAFT_397257 [Rhypophila decipiens]
MLLPSKDKGGAVCLALVNLGIAALVTSLVVNPKSTPAIANVATHIISRGPEELRGGFLKDCPYSGSLDYPHTYRASCPDNTSLDLNNCFVNMNGQMSWLARGGGIDSCRDCHGSYPGCLRENRDCHIITCYCYEGGTNATTVVENTVNLNDGIYVQNGRLTCFGIEGQKEGDH